MVARRRLGIAPSALRDLEDIASHIREHDPAAAARQVEHILRKADGLREYPEMGIARERLAPGLRSVVEAPYIVFYYPHPDRIEIVRVFHRRQDVEHEMLSFISRYFRGAAN